MLGRLHVEIDERPRALVGRLRQRGGEEARQRIEDLGVAWSCDPCRAQVTNGVDGAPEALLGDLGCSREGARAPRRVVGARGLGNPHRDALLVFASRREEAIERFEERRVVRHDGDRALDVGDCAVGVAELLAEGGDDAKLVRDGRGGGDEAKAEAAGADGLRAVAGGVVDLHEYVERAAIDARLGGGARDRSLEQLDGDDVPMQARVLDAGRVDLERRAARVERLDLGFRSEELGETLPIAVHRDVPNERLTNGADAGIELDGSFERGAGGVGA